MASWNKELSGNTGSNRKKFEPNLWRSQSVRTLPSAMQTNKNDNTKVGAIGKKPDILRNQPTQNKKPLTTQEPRLKEQQAESTSKRSPIEAETTTWSKGPSGEGPKRKRDSSTSSDEEDAEYLGRAADDLDLSHYFNNKDKLVGKFKVLPMKTVNVLFVGRSGTGKSAFIKQLLDPTRGVRSPTGYSTTRMPECHRCAVANEDLPCQYQLNLIDTPGLDEHRREVRRAEGRKDAELISLLREFMKYNVTFLNAVVFVSRAGYTNTHDLDVFLKLIDVLGYDFSSNTFLLLTHSENLADEDMQEYKENLRKHEDCKVVYNYCKKGVLFSGGINMDSVHIQKRNQKEFVSGLAKTVRRLRESVLQALIDCANSPIEIDKLRILDEVEKEPKRGSLRSATANSFCSAM